MFFHTITKLKIIYYVFFYLKNFAKKKKFFFLNENKMAEKKTVKSQRYKWTAGVIDWKTVSGIGLSLIITKLTIFFFNASKFSGVFLFYFSLLPFFPPLPLPTTVSNKQTKNSITDSFAPNHHHRWYFIRNEKFTIFFFFKKITNTNDYNKLANSSKSVNEKRKNKYD